MAKDADDFALEAEQKAVSILKGLTLLSQDRLVIDKDGEWRGGQGIGPTVWARLKPVMSFLRPVAEKISEAFRWIEEQRAELERDRQKAARALEVAEQLRAEMSKEQVSRLDDAWNDIGGP